MAVLGEDDELEDEEDSEEKELEDIVWRVGRAEEVGSEGRVGCGFEEGVSGSCQWTIN